MKLRFVGIRRKTEFSPNHVENDLMIINRTAEELEKLGGSVEFVDEGELSHSSLKSEFVFSMVQGPTGTKILSEIAKSTTLFIINTPESVANCYRTNMVRLLPERGIPFPKSHVVSTDFSNFDLSNLSLAGKVWVKRGDVHAVHREDVVLAYKQEEAMMILREFCQRGINTAILQEHLVGDTVKFYAVRGSDFFHSYHLNGTYHTTFDQKELKRLAALSAETLGLYVYGGDAIIETDGSIRIIDINDWPSFAPVRDEASGEIARVIYQKAEEYCSERNNEPVRAD